MKSLFIKKTANASPFIIPEAKQVTKLKILGITFNDKLSWDDHIDDTYKKACQRLHALRVLKPVLSPSDLRRFYVACILTILEYGCPVWFGLNNKLSRRLDLLQKRAARIIGHSNALQPLADRRKLISTKLFRRIISNPDHILKDCLPTFSARARRILLRPASTNRRLRSFFHAMSIIHNSVS